MPQNRLPVKYPFDGGNIPRQITLKSRRKGELISYAILCLTVTSEVPNQSKLTNIFYNFDVVIESWRWVGAGRRNVEFRAVINQDRLMQFPAISLLQGSLLSQGGRDQTQGSDKHSADQGTIYRSYLWSSFLSESQGPHLTSEADNICLVHSSAITSAQASEIIKIILSPFDISPFRDN